jgi:hypothetical protein
MVLGAPANRLGTRPDGTQVRPWLLLGAIGGLLLSLWLARRRKEESEDFGTALVELFAYFGDVLSGYQEAIANEGFLASAARRRSVGTIGRRFRSRSARGMCRTRRRHRRWPGRRR